METRLNTMFDLVEQGVSPSMADKEVENIRNVFTMYENDSNSLDANIVTLFNESRGLLAYLDKSVHQKEFKHSTEKTLEIVHMLVNNFPNKLESYISNIIKSCVFTCQHPKSSAKAQQTALEVTKMILEKKISLKLDEALLYKVYKMLKSKLKDRDTVKTVLSTVVEVIGVLSKHHFGILCEDGEDLLRELVISLDCAIKDRDPKKILIKGLFIGISDHLFSFQLNDELQAKLYKSIQAYCVYPISRALHDRTPNRAALSLFTVHYRIFTNSIHQEWHWWYTNLMEWFDKSDVDYKAGFKALDALYFELVNVLKLNHDAAMFKDLTRIFLEGMEVKRRMRVSVKGLGYLADVYGDYSTETYNVFMQLIQKVEFLYFENTSDKYLEHLPDYIETLSNFVKQLEELNAANILLLQKVTILMIKLFPKLSVIHHSLAINAIINIMYCIKNCKSNNLSDFMQDVIQQGVYWSCSHLLDKDVEMLPENTNKFSTYKSYLPLWLGLLNMQQINSNKHEITPQTLNDMFKTLLDGLVKTLLRIMSKLDFNLTTKQTEEYWTNPVMLYNPSKIHDLTIFANVVDLYVDLFNHINPEHLQAFIPKMIHHNIRKSYKYPLISGFYKLIASVLKICETSNYFDITTVLKDDKKTTFESSRKFIKNLLPKMKEFKDDLLLSCSQIILASPVILIDSIDDDFAPVFIVIFTMGRSYLQAASDAVDAIERWNRHISEEKMRPFLMQVLPMLDSFLRTPHKSGIASNQLVHTTKSQKRFDKQRVFIEAESELFVLQQKILCLLAKMDNELCLQFVNDNALVSPTIWGKDMHLKVSLPFQEGNVSLYLDKFIPRILELALYSSDRKTKIAACELLHSTVMVVLGTYRLIPDKANEMDVLLEKIVRALLKLGSDNDETIQSMFHPLLLQMVHWYADSKQNGSQQTYLVVEILLDSISNPSESNIRDISGQCIKEFVSWCQKQRKDNTSNIDVIVDKIKYFSTHPDPAKRYGAALIFNNIYTILRESDLYLNRYWLSLLQIFITSLSQIPYKNTHKDDSLVQIELALEHLMRVFIECASLFNVKASKRVTPTKFQKYFLKDVAVFLLENTNSLNIHCRNKSTEMFLKIAPLVANCDANEIINERSELFFTSYEHDLCKDVTECSDLNGVFKWMHSFICLLDGFIFVYDGVVSQNNYNTEKLYILLGHYLKNVPIKLDSLEVDITTTHMNDEFVYLQTILCDRILQFAIVVLEQDRYNVEFFNVDFWRFLCGYMFDYLSLGYELGAIDDWENKCLRVVRLIKSKLPGDVSSCFEDYIREYIDENMIEYDPRFNLTMTQSKRQLLRGMLVLSKTDVDISDYTKGVELIATKLKEVKGSQIYVKKLHHTVQQYCDLLLQLSLSSHESEFYELLHHICTWRNVHNLENNSLEMYGIYFFRTFELTIIKTILKDNNFELFMSKMFTNMPEQHIPTLLSTILKYSEKNSKVLDNSVVNVMSKLWTTQIVPKLSSPSKGIELLENLAFAKNINSEAILNWLLGLFQSDLNGKSKENKFDFLLKLIHVLRLFIQPGLNATVSNALEVMKTTHLQLFELKSNSISLTLLIRKLFETSNITNSVDMLVFALNIYTTIENQFEGDLPQYLKTYLQNSATQLETIQQLYKECFKPQYKPLEKVSLTKHVCVLLIHCNHDVFENFFIAIIKDIINAIKQTKFNEDICINKIINYLLIESLYLRIDTDNINCPIQLEAFSGTIPKGKDLVKLLFRFIVNVCTETMDKNLHELFRLYQCHAYNAFVSIICNVKRDNLALYKRLFCREADNVEIMWGKIVDSSITYTFDLNVDNLTPRKTFLTKIRTNKPATTQNISYIESQSLLYSTLNEDVNCYDFNNAIVRTQPVLDENGQMVDFGHTASVELELFVDDINGHECMHSVCGLLVHMGDRGLLGDGSDMPVWVKDIRKLLFSDATGRNVKLFWARAIGNVKDVVTVQGKWLMGPIMKIIVDGCAGNQFNGFVADMAVMLFTSWYDVEICPEDKPIISDFVNHLMKTLTYESAEIFKYHLEIIASAVEKWKYDIKVPHKYILDKLDVDINSKQMLIGIRLSNTLLANQIAPWNTMQTFAKRLTSSLESTNFRVRNAAAEMIGLAALYVYRNDASKCAKFEEMLMKSLEKVKSSNSSHSVDKFVSIIDNISKHYPSICNAFVRDLVYSKKTPTILRILLKCIKYVHENGYFNQLDIVELLTDKIDIVVTTLEIVLVSIDEASVGQLQDIITKVCSFANCIHSKCREVMYDILMKVYNKYYRSDDEVCVEVVAMARDVLLKGLLETEFDTESKLLQFWADHEAIPGDSSGKILFLLQQMYSTSTEDIYLSYANFILLHSVKGSPNYSKNIYDYPLNTCTFSDYNLSTSWKSRYSTMTPMFTYSLSCSHSQGSTGNVLKMTQSLRFNPTIDEDDDVSDGESDSNPGLWQNDAIKDPNDYAISNKYRLTRRRFKKDKDETKKYFSSQAINLNIQKEKSRRDRVKKLEGEINLYRKYRIGEIPDVEIPLSAVIDPLQAVAKMDGEISKILFKSLFDSALNVSSDADNFVHSVSDSINHIFKNSVNYTPNLMSVLLNIALTYKNSIKFDPQLICNVCQYSGLMSIGCLLLEEYLISSVEVEPSVKRGRLAEVDDATRHWMKLAELYKTMEDWDMLRSIFLMGQINCPQNILKAIEAESEGLWMQAYTSYNTALTEDFDVDRKDFYYASYFNCLQELLNWDQITKTIETTITVENTWEGLWQDEWSKQKLLPSYLEAKMRLAITNDTVKNDLTSKISNILNNNEQGSYLKDNFPQDLAFLGIINNDIHSSKRYIHTFITNFLSNWSYINPLFSLLRSQKLITLQNIMDMFLFIQNYEKLNDTNYESVLNECTYVWDKNMKRDTCAMDLQNVCRKQYINLIKNKLQNQLNLPNAELSVVNQTFAKFVLKSNENMVDIALERRNFHAARVYHKLLQSSVSNSLALSKINLLGGKLKGQLFNHAVKSINQTSTLLNNAVVKSDQQLLLNTAVHFNDIIQDICGTSQNVDLSAIRKYIQSPIETCADLEEYGCKYLRSVLDNCEGVGADLAGPYLKLAQVMVRKGEARVEDLIYYTFKAMRLQSDEARQLFPYLLNLESLGEHRQQFVEECSNTPVWMFLQWIPQLLAYLDSEKIHAISALVIKIAENYPNAIIYAYKISKMKYKFSETESGQLTLQTCNELDSRLNKPLVDKILESISSVVLPAVKLKYVVTRLSSVTSVSEESYRSEGRSLFQNLYGKAYNYSDEESIRGKVFKKVDTFKTTLNKVIEGKFDAQKIKTDLDAINGEIRIKTATRTVVYDLDEFSPWLKNFHSNNYDEEVEMPGQYKGNKRPLVQYHVKITGFKTEVRKFQSLQSPLQLTILGSDTKEYKFLVKYGEDLRQDQRIEQVFNLMNTVLQNDASCSKRKLNIITYEVIPLTVNLGLIEWVEGSEELGKIIESSMPDSNSLTTYKGLIVEHLAWTKKMSPKNVDPKDINALFKSVIMKVDRDTTCINYKTMVSKVPLDLLRKWFFAMSSDTESLFALRDRFIKSYAVMCVSNWLVGIGDRHQANILISKKSGDAIGIDFGYAFGTATDALGVPELIPFRLTPQLISLMQPQKEHGKFEQIMVHTLRAFRSKRDVLLAAMSTFIQEPTLNWIASGGSGGDDVWYPKRKISIVREKFDGVNPYMIMSNEVKSRRKDDSQLTLKYLELLKGDERFNARTLKGRELSVEEQVKCLLDQATDEHILGKTYSGWMAWC